MADTGTEKLLINLFCYNLTINTGVDTRVVTATRYIHYLHIWKYCDKYTILGKGALKVNIILVLSHSDSVKNL